MKGTVEMELMSSAFDSGDSIPDKYTCLGENISPPLVWRTVPKGTKSLALVCDDPDAQNGMWSHWVLYDIPADRQELPEGLEPKGRFPWGGVQGRNDFGGVGYGGPCPPMGETHRYFWRLYALDAPCALGAGATRAQLLDWAHDHTLGVAELMGRFARS
ncbi:MAG: YbhB/YbcL family Raf kinase inhibitor-like protein [Anaerolineae bacterium]|jgi:Raf kinase inhibitor-like YbhB/YbcL family protein